MKRIIVEALARIDLNQQFDYIAQDSLQAAQSYFDAAMGSFKLISESPGIGHPRRSKIQQLAGMRSLPVRGFENYLIFYIPDDEKVRIVRVLHGARDIPAILRNVT